MDGQKYRIDGFEGCFAIAKCGGERVMISVSELPDGAIKGSVIKLAADGGYILDPDSEKQKIKTVKNPFEILLQ
ncbi:MAG: hypothetical protein IKM04_01220 [Clostridia bacterium]|nr:hypothetical protein [Clostridia bacterium]